jgi:hypothetical protein
MVLATKYQTHFAASRKLGKSSKKTVGLAAAQDWPTRAQSVIVWNAGPNAPGKEAVKGAQRRFAVEDP